MTKNQLKKNVFLVIFAFFLIFFIAAIVRVFSEFAYSEIKDFSSIFIAMGAAYLAFCFQRRQAFLISLRDLWKEMVEAKMELLEYANNPSPDREAYSQAYRALSKAIDLVRGVYMNCGEDERNIGLYPFEPMHDMMRSLQRIGPACVDDEIQRVEREAIINAWNSLRGAFLKEFARPVPENPVVEYNTVDTRRL